MYDYLYNHVKRAQKRLFTIIMLTITNFILIFIIPNLFDKPLSTSLFIFLVSFFMILFLAFIFQTIRVGKLLKKVTLERLLPFTLNKVNEQWKICHECINNHEINDSIFIDHNSQIVASFKIVDGDATFANILNYLTMGDTDKVIFKGTLITYHLPQSFHKIIHIRMKGKPVFRNIVNHKLKKINNSEINSYPHITLYSNEEILDGLFYSKLIELYMMIKDKFNKHINFTIANNKIYIGINSSVNFADYSLFKPLNDGMIEDKIRYLVKIDETINLIRNTIKTI